MKPGATTRPEASIDFGPGDFPPAADGFDPTAVEEDVADGIGPGAGIDQPPVLDQDFQDVSVSG